MAIEEHGISPPPLADNMEELNLWLNELVGKFPKISTYDLAITPSSVGANATSEQSFALQGIGTSDIIYVNKPTHTTGIAVGASRASAKDEISITYINTTAGGLTPPAETYKIAAIRR